MISEIIYNFFFSIDKKKVLIQNYRSLSIILKKRIANKIIVKYLAIMGTLFFVLKNNILNQKKTHYPHCRNCNNH